MTENKICPKKAEECDFKCGYDVHESNQENQDSNVCLSCEG